MAKWYPGGDGAYYSTMPDTLDQRFGQFLIDHAHPELPSKHYLAGAGQENPVRLEYESEGLPKLDIIPANHGQNGEK